ncbi:hypothetical protein [Estrella lausannensis]|uniref:Uncharacterized protein n=1 Tax=Estrella lausannensis TaxID=483423 RepID=A0A0H5DPU4_9BACT|nr:hypothetical protein [Estrella lausannensis]CRX38596.1 hypothetical protein ELAC_1255 [Estrella lausannensis]
MRIYFDSNIRHIGFFEPVVYLKKERLSGLSSFLWNLGEFADRMCYLGNSTTYISEAASVTYLKAKIKPMSCYSLQEESGIKALFFKVAKAAALLFLFPLLFLLKLYYKAFCIQGCLVTDRYLLDPEKIGEGLQTKREVLCIIEELFNYFEGVRLPSPIAESLSNRMFEEWVKLRSLEECFGYLAALELSLILALSSGEGSRPGILTQMGKPRGGRVLTENVLRILANAWGRILSDPGVLSLDDMKGPISTFSRLALILFLKSPSAIEVADRNRVIRALQLYDIVPDW